MPFADVSGMGLHLVPTVRWIVSITALDLRLQGQQWDLPHVVYMLAALVVGTYCRHGQDYTHNHFQRARSGSFSLTTADSATQPPTQALCGTKAASCRPSADGIQCI